MIRVIHHVQITVPLYGRINWATFNLSCAAHRSITSRSPTGGRHAKGVTLSTLSIVANQSGFTEISTAAGVLVRRLPEERTDRRDC
jgi:hypothetical protein